MFAVTNSMERETMPNTENIEKWVDALRSGEYSQDAENLRTDAGYCCMGVASDVSGCGTWKRNDNGQWWFTNGDEKEDAYPALSVVDWLGLTDEDDKDSRVLHVHYEGEYRELASLNDSEGLSFAEIADLIEAEWLS